MTDLFFIVTKTSKDFKNRKVKTLIKTAIAFAKEDMDKPTSSIGLTISKIKRKK